jgi:multidrug efflux pump subunit AcrA (membrane-fusion protein)
MATTSSVPARFSTARRVGRIFVKRFNGRSTLIVVLLVAVVLGLALATIRNGTTLGGITGRESTDDAYVRAAEAVLKQVRLQHARQRGLVGDGTTSQRELEAAEADDARLSASLDEKSAEWGAAKELLQVIRAQILQAQQGVKTQEAVLELARIDLRYTRIVSPASGQLSERASLPGEYVTPGTKIGLVVPLPRSDRCELSRSADGPHVSGSSGRDYSR